MGVGSLIICLPSLYVLAAVGGAPLSLSQAFALGSSALAVMGFLLGGLAPVAWLFAMSTESGLFMVILVVVIWAIGTAFAWRSLLRLQGGRLFPRMAGIRLWFFILALVTLQMATCLRPMLDTPEHGWWTHDKKFFLAHFSAMLDRREAPTQVRGPR
jgi:hypothetical protein